MLVSRNETYNKLFLSNMQFATNKIQFCEFRVIFIHGFKLKIKFRLLRKLKRMLNCILLKIKEITFK